MELTPQEFVNTWRGTSLKERSASQSHFNELCGLLRVPTPTQEDQSGETYTFERGVVKSAGPTGAGRGFADVWKKGCFAWEYKGPHANLEKALDQLRQYQGSLENPPLLVVSDLETIQVHTNFNNSVSRKTVFELEDLLIPDKLEQLRKVWTNPFAFRSEETPEQVTEQAAREFARLAEILRTRGESADQAAHFLIRILFCLFAEDIRLLPENLFTNLVAATRTRPEAFAVQLRQLFGAMRTGGFFGVEEIPHFNGGLFDNDEALELDAEGMGIMHRVSRLDWGSVEPAILGTLFERSLDPAKRAQLGAHYTSREDILRVVEPVLMAPLRREWETLREKTGREKSLKKTERDLTGFAEKLRGQRVLDQACGSGNFLYVALKELLDLEKEVRDFAGKMGLPEFFPGVGPEQLRGIEVNEYARELATVTVQIGYIQWLRDNGFGRPAEPILKSLETVERMDALMVRDENGELKEPEWPEADVIVGNPPFLGDRRMRTELGHEYVESLRRQYEGRVPGGADLVAYWFERARNMIAEGRAKRAGLLATNSIRGGANRRILQEIGKTGSIFFAESDRPWILNGAAVRVSMVGFDDGEEATKMLDGVPVGDINPDLTGDLNLTMAAKLPENSSIAFYGTVKIGPFNIEQAVAEEMLASVGNPNGRPNKDVVKPWANAMDVTRRPSNMWAIDFGLDMPLEEAALYEKPFEYVRTHVKPMRDEVRRKKYREVWWLFGEPCPSMRRALAQLSRYIATPRVSKHRLFVWLDRQVVPDNAVVVFARDDDYFFGVLHSRAHELWALRMGSSLGVGNDPRYTPTSTFATYPFPWLPGEEPAEDARVQAVAEAAKRLDELRRNWLNPEGASEAELKKRTLTNLYKPCPTWPTTNRVAAGGTKRSAKT